MGKRPSFVEVATDRLGFLADDHGFAGPEIQHPGERIPTIAYVSYHRSDATVEIVSCQFSQDLLYERTTTAMRGSTQFVLSGTAYRYVPIPQDAT